ncbi:MAG: glycosyltransferase [Candidatus Kapabacteria bacterium]|nr:glycosyltransferase [Candidatus Kapabacteria bacterium]
MFFDRVNPKISVCLIVKNEEKMLPDCLKSVQSYVEEIIVVDTGSQDRTKEIAKSFGCKIFDFTWNRNFAEARNFSLSKATSEFILVLDADERLINPEELKIAIRSSQPDTGGWFVEIHSESGINQNTPDNYKNSLVRLFINHPNVKYQGRIHEQIVESILKNGYKLENTNIRIRHLGYKNTEVDLRNKQLRNLELLNEAILENPTDGYSLFQRAKTYLAINDLQNAEKDIQSSLINIVDGNVVMPQALNYGAIIAFRNGDFRKAIERALKSLEIIPEQTFANFVLGEVYFSMNNFTQAINYYSRMLIEMSKNNFVAKLSGDYYLPPEQLEYKIGRCYLGLNDTEKAKEHFSFGNQMNEYDINCLVGLANIYYIKGNFNTALNYLNKAKSINPLKEIDNFIVQVETAAKKSVESNNNTNFNNISKPFLFLSLSMIVKNEEKMLEGCLESVKGVADEIIIVDTGSTDNTLQIAKNYGAKIIHYRWNNDFAAARNESLRNCTGEWILYLDADERLDEYSRGKILELLKSADVNTAGFMVTIESDHIQLDGSIELHRGGYPRIFRNLGYPTIKFEGRVHEQITPSIFALGKSIAFSDLKIIHLGYNQSKEVMQEKIKRNYQLLIAHVQEEPLNGYAWYQLGQTLAQMMLFKEAEDAIRFSIQTGKLSDSVYASAASTLAQLVGNQRKYDEALYWAEKSIEKAPNQVYAMNLKAYSLLHLGKYKEAEQVFIEVLARLQKMNGIPQSGFDIQIPENVVLVGLNKAREKAAIQVN